MGKIDKAFILAAGLGTRLRPYTDAIPKPMVAVGGVPMIDQALDRLAAVGVEGCTVNTHYKAEVLQAHLAVRMEAPRITISHEEMLLDTGGGIVNALGEFDSTFDSAFYVLSGDSVWEEREGSDMLRDLAAAWDPSKMDILMVLQPVERMVLTQGAGDYDLLEDGRAVRSLNKTGRYMFTSVRINARHIFDGAPEGAFSYLKLMDAAERAGRLYGIEYRGDWHHISTPADLDAVNAALAARKVEDA